MDAHTTVGEAEIRDAERALEAALEDPDPTAWVFEYTEDAVFDGGGDHAVVGRPLAGGCRAHRLMGWFKRRRTTGGEKHRRADS